MTIELNHTILRAADRKKSVQFYRDTNHDCVVECLETCTSLDHPPNYPPTHAGLWTENMHTYAYAYRWDERGTLPEPELGAQTEDNREP